MGMIEDRNDKDVTEAEETKMRWQEYTKAMANLDRVLKSRDITLPTKVHTISVLYCALPCKKCSLDIYNFLFPFYCFTLFLCIFHFRRPYVPFLFSGALHSVGYIFPFLPCLLLLFFSHLFLKTPHTSTLPSYISFSLECF